ncbi:MAG: oligosaccharide flippase family protein [Cyanobacteria bacterium P01_E01_bin.48]
MRSSNSFTLLIRGAGAALTIQIVSAGVLYGSQVLLARWMGTVAYGIYDYVTALSLFLAFVAGCGWPTAVLRFIPTYRARGDWALLRGMMRGSWQQTVLVSAIASACGTAVVLGLDATRGLGAYAMPLVVGVWSVPIVALTNLQRETVRSLQNIALAYAPSLLVQPLLLTGMSAIWKQQQDLTSTIAIALSLLSALMALVGQWLLFQQSLDARICRARSAYESALWWQVALPLLLVGSSHVVLNQTDTLMIGALLSAREVGIYSAALKTSSWVPFILIAVNAVAAPLIASLYAQGDRRELQQLVSTIARWMFYPAFATAIGLIGFAEPVLLLFGPEFVMAKGALIALILGQLANVGAGSVGYLMTMTGHHAQTVRVMGVTALANIVLNWIGIEFLGIVGAALATALSMAVWNVWLYVLVVRKLGVRPSILDAF